MSNGKLLGVVAAFLVLVPLSACSTSTIKTSCTDNNTSCTVDVKSDGTAKTKLFKQKLEIKFSNLKDDRLDVREGRTTRTVKEGQTETIGRVRVEVKDADLGAAKLVITRE